MPLNSPKRKISDMENKLRVLYCLDALGMATQEQLWPFVARLELMEYIPFCMYLDELRSDGAVSAASHGLEGALYLTVAGRQQLELFAGKMAHADKERIAQAAPEYAEHLSQRRQISAVYEGAEDGWYRAACTVSEGDAPMLRLRLATRDHVLAEMAVKRFAACVPHLLTLLYTLSFEPLMAPPAGEEADVHPGQPAVCAFGGREHAGAVAVGDGEAAYTLMLMMPDASLAWGWAKAADAADAELAARMTALLRGTQA